MYDQLQQAIIRKIADNKLRHHTFYVSGEHLLKLHDISKETNVSINQLVRTCIDALIEVHNQS